jgi:branched-chain amino acid transport system permease protein
MSFLIVQALSGLAAAATLFLVASGLTLVFGVTRIVNFAHGSLYMLGAYIGWSLIERFGSTPLGFWSSVIAAALVVGALGAAMELGLLRRLYRAPPLFQLLATFAVALIVQDVALRLWGAEDLLGRRAPLLRGAADVLGRPFPLYDLVLVGLGPLVMAGLWLLTNRTRFGVLLRAATENRELTAALGVDSAKLFTAVLFLGSALAGLGGALQVPREAVNLHMDMTMIVEAFVVVVVGGMGSVTGAFLAALMIGQLHAFGILLFPQATLVMVFAFMAVMLVLRPHGLLGRAEETREAPPPPSGAPFLSSSALKILGFIVLAALAALPLAAGPFALTVLTEALILALFAASLQMLIGLGGLVSFGHAAYFGLGAYAAALSVAKLGASMTPALALAPLAGALGALAFGWFCVRRAGIYLAMLTLAWAQIVWSAAFQWTGLTGGDNGILGVRPDAWASSATAFYWLTLALAGGGVLLLARLRAAPLGMALRACRDDERRAEALGIDALSVRWAAFIAAGALAGLAGGLYAFAKGSVFPATLEVAASVDALLMVLLGGLHSLWGAVAGAGLFHGLEAEAMRRTDAWRLVLGVVTLALVLLFPGGLAGAFRRKEGRR